MVCGYCDLIKAKRYTVMEDNELVVMLNPMPSTPGHVIVVPKHHITIMEQLSGSIVSRMFVLANKLSATLFDSLGLNGTNIMMHNGLAAGQQIPHVAMHIVPRYQQDGLNLQWVPRQLPEEEMSRIESLLKENVPVMQEEGKTEVIDLDKGKTEKKIEEKKPGKKDNYLLRQLERRP